MTMSECEVFHVFTRSDMKELFHDTKCMVVHGKWKNRVILKIRVDVCRRSDNLCENRVKRTGLGVSHRDRLVLVTYTDGLCKYVWSHDDTTDQQYHEWLSTRRDRRYQF